jgi:phospholipid/cholesterol/gamma-HCH transport system substrate-binding protein
VDDYRGFTEIYTTDINTTNADDPDAQFRETRVETTDRFKVSLLYGQAFEINPWLAIGGRFGLIESTGGVGAELFLLPDRALMVQADVFSFSYDINPRVRTTATLDFLTHFYIAAGVDDIFNDRTEYFFGGGLRFDDEDLKAILTTTGVPSP